MRTSEQRINKTTRNSIFRWFWNRRRQSNVREHEMFVFDRFFIVVDCAFFYYAFLLFCSCSILVSKRGNAQATKGVSRQSNERNLCVCGNNIRMNVINCELDELLSIFFLFLFFFTISFRLFFTFQISSFFSVWRTPFALVRYDRSIEFSILLLCWSVSVNLIFIDLPKTPSIHENSLILFLKNTCVYDTINVCSD